MLRPELLQVSSEAAWSALANEVRRSMARRVGDEAAVDDLVQDVFERVHSRATELRDHERLAAWVGRITRTILADYYRRTRPTEPMLDEPAAEPDDEPIGTAPLAAWVGGELQRMDPAYREVLTLTEIQGLTQREAAERLGLSLPAVKSRVLRGRAKLRESLQGCCRVELDRRGGVVDWSARSGCC